MQRILLDTSVYIRDLRDNGGVAFAIRTLGPSSPVWLSAVVLEELYAGAQGRSRRAIERLERDFARTRRIVVPTFNDWATVGRVLSEFAARFDYEAIGRGRLTNDAVIAISSRRMGITVLTANARDFARLAEVQPFSWQLAQVREDKL